MTFVIMNFLRQTDTVKQAGWGYTGLILLLVVLPLNGEGQLLGKLNDNYVLQIRFDYLSHALMFVPWVLMMGYGYKLYQKSFAWMVRGYGLALSFAIFCEYLQLPIPYRTFNINDMLANVIGVTLGCIMGWGWIRMNASSLRV